VKKSNLLKTLLLIVFALRIIKTHASVMPDYKVSISCGFNYFKQYSYYYWEGGFLNSINYSAGPLFYRGIALESKFSKWSLTVKYSRQQILIEKTKIDNYNISRSYVHLLRDKVDIFGLNASFDIINRKRWFAGMVVGYALPSKGIFETRNNTILKRDQQGEWKPNGEYAHKRAGSYKFGVRTGLKGKEEKWDVSLCAGMDLLRHNVNRGQDYYTLETGVKYYFVELGFAYNINGLLRGNRKKNE